MIDLHLHTTASDGRLEPEALVRRAHERGVTVLAVTDHDTVGGLERVAAAARECEVDTLPGIEISAVVDARDVHMLGYFFDPAHPGLLEFLDAQLADRGRRAREMADRLASLGVPIAVEPLLVAAAAGRSVGRPLVAQALVDAGHVSDFREAFETWIGNDGPAYVPRRGAPPAGVLEVVHAAGGIVSLAHPGVLARDALIPGLVEAGLDAIEVYHSDHDADQVAAYLAVAGRYGLAVSGGSDYHGDVGRRQHSLGQVGLPEPHFLELRRRAEAL